MPLLKKKITRRFPARRRIVRRRMPRRLPLTRGIAQPVQLFKRSTYTTNWLLNDTIIDKFKNLTFTLADVPNHDEFTKLYDQYCLKGVSFCLIPKFNVNDVNTANVPPVWSILDYDGTFPTTKDAMLQYQNLRMIPGQKWHKRYIKPRVLQEVYQSPLATAYSPKKSQFIDCQNDTVPHYGATVMLLPGNVGNEPFAYDLKVTYYLAFKNVR